MKKQEPKIHNGDNIGIKVDGGHAKGADAIKMILEAPVDTSVKKAALKTLRHINDSGTMANISHSTITMPK